MCIELCENVQISIMAVHVQARINILRFSSEKCLTFGSESYHINGSATHMALIIYLAFSRMI